mmetsp:Transcript_43420/g.51091  ORF Transcript_43420/g.51091 Transcript_43420/m.51091 type:complete len:80 (+) Transcript_43420:523-762(+)
MYIRNMKMKFQKKDLIKNTAFAASKSVLLTRKQTSTCRLKPVRAQEELSLDIDFFTAVVPYKTPCPSSIDPDEEAKSIS